MSFLRNFFSCGAFGWCLECFWTGMHSIFSGKDKKLRCQTSVWMFPIYGMAAVLGPLSKKLCRVPILLRGFVYMFLIYLGEFFSGSILKKHNSCPWDYSKAKFNYKGLIRFDYAPAWFLSGLLFEQLLRAPWKKEP